jgi:hypothetical protein
MGGASCCHPPLPRLLKPSFPSTNPNPLLNCRAKSKVKYVLRAERALVRLVRAAHALRHTVSAARPMAPEGTYECSGALAVVGGEVYRHVGQRGCAVDG